MGSQGVAVTEARAEASRQPVSRRIAWHRLLGCAVLAFCGWWYVALTWVVLPPAMDHVLATEGVGGRSFFVAGHSPGVYAVHVGSTLLPNGVFMATRKMFQPGGGVLWLPWAPPWWLASHALAALLVVGVVLLLLPRWRRIAVVVPAMAAAWAVRSIIVANVVPK